MKTQLLRRFVAAPMMASLWAAAPFAVAPAAASDSPAFDRACVVYYRQGNDPDVTKDVAGQFCTCLGAEYANEGLGEDALDFFARTLSEDLTTFMQDYPEGDAWMEASFRADKQCKSADYGSNEPPPAGDYPREAGSWGGVVRSGPGREFSRVGTLEEGESVTLLENAGAMDNGYPWFKIRYRGKRQGYQWGGILCSTGEEVPEIFQTCP